MKARLETLCGCSRECDVRTENGNPPEAVKLGIMERISTRQKIDINDSIEFRYRTFEFQCRKTDDGLWVYLEKWEKAK